MTEEVHKGIIIVLHDRTGRYQEYDILDRTSRGIIAMGSFNSELEAPFDVLERIKLNWKAYSNSGSKSSAARVHGEV